MRERIVGVVLGLVLVVTLLVPAVAFAGASTDAALGLGAFAVFNQMLGGVGIFGSPHPAAVVAPPAVVVAPPPPPPVVVYPYAYPAYYYATPVYYQPRYYVVPGRCPPGLARQGRCGGWAFHHH